MALLSGELRLAALVSPPAAGGGKVPPSAKRSGVGGD
jgi:hypothetical protein